MAPDEPSAPTVVGRGRDTLDWSEQDALEAATTLVGRHREAAAARVRPPAPAPAPAQEMAQQTVLPAPYEDRGEIGRGGMGSVRAAYDGELGRSVAVKSMLPELAAHPDLVRNFVDEARVLAMIDHPNVAPVHRLERGADGSLLIVMKLIDGTSLAELLRGRGDEPWTAEGLDGVLSVLVKVCDAVAHAHSRGVLHLDLKPDNVMVGSFGQVYVVDWGIARRMPESAYPMPGDTLSSPPGASGTPSYMSPEQALFDEDRLDGRTDVYQLGAILYQVLTGSAPHAVGGPIEVIASAIRGVVEPPQQRAPGRTVPAQLAAIAMRALAPDPADRFATVLDLQREVRAFQRGDSRAPCRAYPAGAVVVAEGEPGDEAFVVVSGRCSVIVADGGADRVVRELGPGDVFGETALLSAQPRSASIVALDDLVVRVVTRETLADVLGLDTWAGRFVTTLAERFREADRRSRDW